MTSEFVHLHVHTEYSLLDGQSRIKDLVARAQELLMPALGISDHGVMFGVIDFYRACRDAGIRPVLGMEAYLAPRTRHDKEAVDKRPYHMLLWAKDLTGYRNLMKLASIAQLEGYYYRPRIDRDLMAQYSAGLIATSGCLAAEIPRLVEDGKDAEARDKIGWYLDVFGEDNFYLELQPHKIGQLQTLNDWLVDYRQSNHTNVQFVASNDVHYVRQDDWDVHDTLLCIQTGANKSDENRMRMNPHDSYYMKSDAEMRAEFLKHGMPEAMLIEAFANSRKIADMTNVNLDDRTYKLPIFPVPPEFKDDSAAYLRYLVMMGLEWRYPGRVDDPILFERMDHELRIIGNMGFNTYFLIVWDLCEWAREADIWWNVRGSGAGSLVAYCLGITNIDPIQNSLLFERFLNPGRVSMPDIDLDYPDDRRAEMIAYAADKYGKDKVAAIITFGTMGAKAAVKDVGRALAIDQNKINRATSLIPQEAKQKKIRQYIDLNPELQDMYNGDQEIKRVMDAAMRLQGMTRHASTHAAGVIIADRPLEEYAPLHRVTGDNADEHPLDAVTQFPMETAESIGLLKVDFLGLSTLTILRKACDLVNRHHGTNWTMDNIPYRHDYTARQLTDDEERMLDETFEMMGRGETIGVFQVESGGMQAMLRGMRPQRFEHVIAGISLYRPGPMEFIPNYNKRLHGEEETPYLHPGLEPILKETFSIIVYQEQIMQIAGQLFGYELGEADMIRKAVSKKKEKDLAKHRETFLERGPQFGIDEDTSAKIFEEIMFFANYGFNKAHATDYAVITVQSAFLKCHYPAEFMTALLTVQFDDSTKVATFLEDCRRMKIPVLPPHVNFSAVDFDIEVTDDGRRGIRFGMGAIKNAGVGALQHIIDEREVNGPFESLIDFCHRVDLRQVGKRTVESLIKVGALGNWGARDDLLIALDRIVGFSVDYHKAQEVGQMSLFGEGTGLADAAGLDIPPAPISKQVSRREQLRWEKELMGLYVSGRPVDRHLETFRAMANLTIISELKRQEDDATYGAPSGTSVKVAGELVDIRKVTTKNGKLMAILQLEDWHESAGTIEVVAFPNTWTRIQHSVAGYKSDRMSANDQQPETEDPALLDLHVGDIVVIAGKFDTARGDAQIICDTLSFEFGISSGTSQYDSAPYDQDLAWLNGNGQGGGSSEEPPLHIPEYDEETGELVEAQFAPAPPINDIALANQGNGVPVTAQPHFNGAGTQPAWMQNNGAVTTQASVRVLNDPFSELVYTAETQDRLHINVHLESTGDASKDRRLLRRLHGILVSYPGQDSFHIVLHNPRFTQAVQFPTSTTGHCEELLRDLTELVGTKNVELRPLK